MIIQFDQLSLAEDGSSLTYEVEMTSETTDYFIQEVWIEYYKNRNVTLAPSSKAIKSYEYTAGDKLTHVGPTTVDKSELYAATHEIDTFKNGLFYVIVIMAPRVVPQEDIPLYKYDVGAVFDWDAVYQLGMRFVYAQQAACNRGHCEVDDSLEEMVLVWHALELALAADDVDMIDQLWSRFIAFGKSGGAQGSTCNCM